MVTIGPQVIGFHYYTLSIDGATVADPATRTCFGSGWYNSAVEIPEPDAAYYSAKDVPHGEVRQRWYYSKVTGQWRRCYVYTPPDYESNTRALSDPVFAARLEEEDEQGWHTQGYADLILDNLIAEEQGEAHDRCHGRPKHHCARSLADVPPPIGDATTPCGLRLRDRCRTPGTRRTGSTRLAR